MMLLFATLDSMEESVQSSGGSNCKLGKDGWEKSLENGLKVCKRQTKSSSNARSDGLEETSKSNKVAARYQDCIPSLIDEKESSGGELYTQKEATNDVDCLNHETANDVDYLNHETSDIPWTLQEYTPLEFAALSQAMAEIDDIDQAISMSPRALMRSLQAQHSSPESRSVRKQSTMERGDNEYESEYGSTVTKWSVRNNPMASLSPESVNNNISDRRRRRSLASTQEKLDLLASPSLWSSTVENNESVSCLSPSFDINLLLGIRNDHTEEELLISTMQIVSSKQNPNPMVRYPKSKFTEFTELDSGEEFSIFKKFEGANAFCMILDEGRSFMKLILRGLNWSLMSIPVAMAAIAIQICCMPEENNVLVPT